MEIGVVEVHTFAKVTEVTILSPAQPLEAGRCRIWFISGFGLWGRSYSHFWPFFLW